MLIIEVIWLLLPAALANMAPILTAKALPKLDTPIDFKKAWNGNELFGSHKTYRGLISGAVTGFIVFNIQQACYQSFSYIEEISFFKYNEVSPFFGAWMGTAALLGDLIKSFFKRRFSIAPGKPWIPFDQIDWIIGALISLRFIFIPSFSLVFTSLFVYLCLHFLFKYIGFLLKLSSTPL